MHAPALPAPALRNLQAAMKALQQLLTMGAAGGAPGLAAVLEPLPEPSEAVAQASGLPDMQGRRRSGWQAAGWPGGHQEDCAAGLPCRSLRRRRLRLLPAR